METIKSTDEKLVFSTELSTNIVNALRRTVSKVPTRAIDEVEISRNDSALYDETVAHRLGLTSIESAMKLKSDEVLEFSLEANEEGTIFAEKITGDVKVVYDRTPITVLGKDQVLSLKGKTKIGIGEEHAKFLPGSLLYRVASQITMPKEFKELVLSKFEDASIKASGDNIIVSDDKEKTLIDFCEGLCVSQNKEYSIKDSNKVIVTIRSFGQLKPKNILKKSIEVLKKELEAVSKELK